MTSSLCFEMRLGLSLGSVAYEGSVRHGNSGVLSLIKLEYARWSPVIFSHGNCMFFLDCAFACVVHAGSSATQATPVLQRVMQCGPRHAK